MSFAGSSDNLPRNHDYNDQAMYAPSVYVAIIRVPLVNITKFISNKLAAIDNLPQAIPVLDGHSPIVDNLILINV